MYNFYFFKYTVEEFILRPMIYTNRYRASSENMDDKRRLRNRQQYQSQQKNELKSYL